LRRGRISSRSRRDRRAAYPARRAYCPASGECF
jgi:hypothetical protein